MLEKTLESPLDCKEIQPVHPKGNKSWIFIGMTDAEAETLILGHLMRRTDSLEKTLMLGMIEGGRRRGWQVEMVRWRLSKLWELVMDREDWSRSLVCCSPWDCKELDMTENWTELNTRYHLFFVTQPIWKRPTCSKKEQHDYCCNFLFWGDDVGAGISQAIHLKKDPEG